MTAGLPVVVTSVGGLTQAAKDYEGAVFVDPGDPDGLRSALDAVVGLVGGRFADPHSWDSTADKYDELFRRLSQADDRPAAATTETSREGG